MSSSTPALSPGWFSDYTSFRGRLPRGLHSLRALFAFLVALFSATALAIAYLFLGLEGAKTYLVIVMVTLAPVLFYVLCSLWVRRLHDVGLSGWWLVPMLAIAVGLMSLAIPMQAVGLMFAIVLIGWLGLLGRPSAEGENRFGPPYVDPAN